MGRIRRGGCRAITGDVGRVGFTKHGVCWGMWGEWRGTRGVAVGALALGQAEYRVKIRSPFETDSPNRTVLDACPRRERVEAEPGDYKERTIVSSRPLYTVDLGHGALDLTVSLRVE